MPAVTHAEVIQIIERNDLIRECLLKPDRYIRFEAGQFLQLSLDLVTASDYWPESRTFSIASYRSKDKMIRLFIKKVGQYTTRIFNELNVGDRCTIKYAYGDFTLPVFDDSCEIVCIAGGTGIAPFLAFVDALAEQDQLERLRLFYSVKCRGDMIDRDFLQNIISPNNFRLFSTREENNEAVCRRIEIGDILMHNSSDMKRHYYICGSKEFTMKYKKLLENEGMPNIFVDEWS